MRGKRIAVLGLGRTGVAVAHASKALGATPVVLDRANSTELPKPELANDLAKAGIELRLGWPGDSTAFENEQVHGVPFLPPSRPAAPADGWLDSSEFDLVVVNPAIDYRAAVLQRAWSAEIEVIGEIEFAFRISKAPIVAITGTNGKSTTTVMMWQCLRELDVDAVLCGNIFGSGYPEMPLSEAAASATGQQVLVAEVSSFQLEWVREFAPVAAAITNVTPDHLNRYDSFEQYRAAKQRIHAAQSQSDFAVDLGHAAGEAARIAPDPSPFAFPARHNDLNAGTALAIVEGLFERLDKPFDREGAIAALRQFKGLAHRMEQVGDRDGVSVVNNSMCTNAAAVLSSVGSLRAETRHVLLGGINKGLDFEELRGLLDGPNRLYLFGQSKDELNAALGGGHPVYDRMREATESALRNARPGDAVILSPGCASMDEFEDFRQRGDVFRAIAKEWLNR